MYLLLRVIGHKTSLSTSQVTATNLAWLTVRSFNPSPWCDLNSESECRGGTCRVIFFQEGGNPEEMCGITLGVFNSTRHYWEIFITVVAFSCGTWVVLHEHGRGGRQVTGGKRGTDRRLGSKCRFSTRWNSWLTATGLQTRSPKISATARRRPTSRGARRRPTASRESCSWVCGEAASRPYRRYGEDVASLLRRVLPVSRKATGDVSQNS